jgi:glutamate-1-semialdehyde 2,1-aminomutase
MSSLQELEQAYIATHPQSYQLYQRAVESYPSGVTHDARYARPFPIYVTHALGTKKWDVDDHVYVDYVMGHGALLFGYGDPEISDAFRQCIGHGIHLGACTELELEWAELIKQLVPSAHDGWVRGTASGTEANQMAIRLARWYTGRDRVVLHTGAYQGKGDATILVSRGPPFGRSNVRGIPDGVRNDVILVPYNDLTAVESAFQTGRVAGIILQGNALYTKEYLTGLRDLTMQYGVVFIMDEVVSGFRYAAGGAQEYYDVTPDLTTLGKVIGGGAPVGAICGQPTILDAYTFKDALWNRFTRIGVGGTWNAQPLPIVGGIAAMRKIASEGPSLYERLYGIGRRLVQYVNTRASELNVTVHALGLPIDNPTTLSIYLLNRAIAPDHRYLWETGPTSFDDYETKAGYTAAAPAQYALYLAMINQGIYSYRGRGGSLCTKYSEEDLTQTEAAIDYALEMLKANQLVGIAN